jgi:Ca2+-binding RTX toxin-like protein
LENYSSIRHLIRSGRRHGGLIDLDQQPERVLWAKFNAEIWKETAMVRIRIGGDTTDDIIDGSALNPNDNWLIYGRGGNDTLTGGNKADLLVGGADNDKLYGLGGKDVLYGDVGNDTLDGGAGNDALHGGADADLLIGGLNQDLMFGGAGADTFEFNAINESGNTIRTADVIADFVEGVDKIDLLDIFGVDFYAGPELNTVVAPHSVFWTQSGGNTIIQVNATFDQTSDMLIVLTGLHNLTAGDFLISPI